MQTVDDATPDCEVEGKGCLIPALTQRGQKVMEMHTLLKSLHDLVDPGTILSMCEAQKEDIEYLAIVEAEVRKNQPKNEN
ncbi:MAG: hypothetical protein DWB56_14930 [Candidatus Jettenia sp.]|uniref:hypothetical protein n=1 Tax=Candidatus Jettenia sp. AMX1 TaxID=2293637 RepID=UPI0003227703|nr:hypothetical protein [Candidatus Jettenia sp. AMX1]KAA0243562.1 MAG: hypothetical protein EDM70_09920 [Candidatus Brocadia sp. AMX2]MBC6930227.1 hypothetical protein [Candidatus Jettenia sp.]GIL19527.1 MAG: hypothetical protein BroJett041_06410 [Candidatus Jettenia caeni]MCQ3927100.1 hypothetical protein [Candidatus Jettenia sp.]GJQ44863.1 MAG: hypothetical protein JETCAE04_06170 [Candidatus Jettenia caeni]